MHFNYLRSTYEENFNNYFNDENVINDTSIKFVLAAGKISPISCETEICYTPLGRE